MNTQYWMENGSKPPGWKEGDPDEKHDEENKPEPVKEPEVQ